MDIPFPFRIIKKKVKHVRIVVHSHGEVELVVPKLMPAIMAAQFLRHKISWVQKKLCSLERNTQNFYLFLGKGYTPILSEQLQPGALKFEEKNVCIGASFEDEAKIYFTCFLERKASEILPKELDRLSGKYNLPFTKLTLRKQKSRWGSCTEQKHISLNIRLVQLPSDIREYVLIHELCHTKYMNHSKKFWQLVETYCPNYKELRKKLKTYLALNPR